MALVERDQSPISRLNLDVLKIIYDIIIEDAIDGDIVKSLDGLSKTNHLLRELCLPALFRATAVVGNWDNALKRLTAMQSSPILDCYAREFKFDLFVEDKKQGPPHNLPSALATRLMRMSQLQKLVLVIPEHHTDIFAKTISRSKISLPAVHTVVVGPFCDFAIQMCPKVTAIANNGWMALRATRGGRMSVQHTRDIIAAAGTARRLESLNITARWEVDLVAAIHESVPGLRRLTLGAGSYKKGIEPLIPMLSRLTELEYLALGNTPTLGIGFNPPGCGNAYHGPNGKLFRQKLRLQRDLAERNAATMVTTACPRLKDLWFGNMTHVEVLRDKSGSFEKYILHRPENREEPV